jgi:flagellar biosynthesis/type III secretory pathway protein FliH
MNDILDLAKSITDAARSAYNEGYAQGYKDGLQRMHAETMKIIGSTGTASADTQKSIEVHERATTGVDRRPYIETIVPGAEE